MIGNVANMKPCRILSNICGNCEFRIVDKWRTSFHTVLNSLADLQVSYQLSVWFS